MNNALRVQLLHHAIGDELVVVGGAQALGDRLEGQHETGEILVRIQGAGFFLGEYAAAVGDVGVAIIRGGERRRMAAAQLRQCGRVD